jgi:OOP family OmpA-OmpF porin
MAVFLNFFKGFIMLKKIIAAAAVAMLAGSSFAADTGAYAGLDVGSTKIDGLSGSKASFGGFVGYNFNQNFAVEGGYRSLGKWDYSGADVKVTQASLSVIGAYPVSPEFSVFGRIGYNRLNADASYMGFSGSDSTSGGMYGFGVGYNFSSQIVGRLEVQKPSSDSTNLSIGVAYKF